MQTTERHFLHQPPLDGIRGMAVLLVMLSHTGVGQIVPGAFGVTVFFFLSGYLITSLLRDEFASTGDIDFKSFYYRRSLRIFPPFYIAIALTVFAMLIGLVPGPVTTLGVIAQGLFLSSYSEWLQLPPGAPLPLWSLAVEEHFYLAFPLLLLLILRRTSPARAAAVCLFLCGMVLAVRVGTWLIDPELLSGWMTHTRIDSILFGSILALWNNPAMDRTAWEPRGWHVVAVLVLLAASQLIAPPFYMHAVKTSVQGAALFVMFSFVLHNRGIVRSLLSSPPAQTIGLLSYTAYLVHLPIILALQSRWPAMPFWLVAITAFPATFLFAWGMYVYVERPIKRWRRTETTRLALNAQG